MFELIWFTLTFFRKLLDIKRPLRPKSLLKVKKLIAQIAEQEMQEMHKRIKKRFREDDDEVAPTNYENKK